MELKTLQKELHRLDQLVGAWHDASDITTLERDLVLARLRDIYEAVLFGLETATEPVEQAPQVVAVAAPVEELPAADAEPIEEPLVFEGEDFFSLDAILPVEEEFAPVEEEVAEEPAEEEVAEEVAPIEEEVAEEPIAEEVEEPIAEVAEEPMPIVEEEIPAVEEMAPEVEEEIPAVEEVAPMVEEIVEEPAPVVEAPKAEPAPAPFQTLFGAEPEVDQHRRKQRVIMSLYDVQEPEPKPVVKEEPKPLVKEEPAPIAEEPAEEPIAAPAEEDAYTPLATPIDETELTDEDVVFELSEGELEEEITDEPAVEEEIDEPAPRVEEPKAVTPTVEEPTVVLGEKLQPQTTLGDQLAARQTVNDLRPRITDLRRAVGLNDKFLLIRDLFNGNGSLYEITIRKLNEFDNFDDCMIYIAEHFAWNPNSDGAKLMMDLLERKFEQQ